jgi:hypothetical protein
MPDSSPIFDWKKFRIHWRGGIWEMNPDPNDYGGQDVRKFFLEQFEYMLTTRQYDLIDQRLILGSTSGGAKPVKMIKEPTQLQGVKFPKEKRKRKRRRK